MKTVVDARALAILGKFFLSNEVQRVILPANTCPVVFALCGSLNIETVSVDLASDLSQVSFEFPETVNNARGSTVLLLVRNYGFIDWTSEFLLEQRAKNLGVDLVVDDRCLCDPSFEGLWADLTLFSFGYSKFVERSGGGAIGFINSGWRYDDISWRYAEDRFTDVARQLYGKSDAHHVGKEQKSISWVMNFDTKEQLNLRRWINQIDYLREEVWDHKNSLNETYRIKLDDLPGAQLLGNQFHNWRFNILCFNRDQIIKNLFANNLFASSHYSVKKIAYPTCFKLSNHIVNLFNSPRVDNAFAEKCCEVICKSLEGHGEPIQTD